MGEELLKHIEILKTVPEIKESIEGLERGCKIKTSYHKGLCEFICIHKGDLYILDENNRPHITDQRIDEKIGQVHEGHLRMFLESNKSSLVLWESGKFLLMNGKKNGGRFEIDNTKPYMNQSEDFFKKLNDWLIKEFNIKL